MPRADYTNGPPPELRRLGSALRELREMAGLKQIEVARDSGLSEGRVSEIENGKNDLRWSTLERMLEGLDVSLGDLAAALERQAGRPET